MSYQCEWKDDTLVIQKVFTKMFHWCSLPKDLTALVKSYAEENIHVVLGPTDEPRLIETWEGGIKVRLSVISINNVPIRNVNLFCLIDKGNQYPMVAILPFYFTNCGQCCNRLEKESDNLSIPIVVEETNVSEGIVITDPVAKKAIGTVTPFLLALRNDFRRLFDMNGNKKKFKRKRF
jgi:hypothetical protein